MARYVITVQKYDETDKLEDEVEVICFTEYALTRDIPEWVKEEIDPNTIIEKGVKE
jgi:hypothetical protein